MRLWAHIYEILLSCFLGTTHLALFVIASVSAPEQLLFSSIARSIDMQAIAVASFVLVSSFVVACAEEPVMQITPDARIEVAPTPSAKKLISKKPVVKRDHLNSEVTPAVRHRHADAVAPAPAVPLAAPPQPSRASGFDFAAQLESAGAKSCAAQINALGAAVMPGVSNVATAANWALTEPDTRPVAVLVGQKFGGGTNVPAGATGIFAAPSAHGGCEGMSVQVVPSPLPCSKVREALSRKGPQIGDLAGVPLMRDDATETMLVPTSADTCVLVGVRLAYAK